MSNQLFWHAGPTEDRSWLARATTFSPVTRKAATSARAFERSLFCRPAAALGPVSARLFADTPRLAAALTFSLQPHSLQVTRLPQILTSPIRGMRPFKDMAKFPRLARKGRISMLQA